MLRPLTREEIRSVDRCAIEQFRIPGILLMENAGRGAAELLAQKSSTGRIVVLAGKGNNGGDGFVIARHLESAGHDVKVLLLADAADLSADAAVNFEIIHRAGFDIFDATKKDWQINWQQQMDDAEWIVDALLGTGATGEIREPYTTVIQMLNQSATKIMAVDVPSGLDCNTGEPLGACVQADCTATFVAEKVGFRKGNAAYYLGKVTAISIGVPRLLLERLFGES